MLCNVLCLSCARSIEILDPLLSEEMRRSPAWASWVALVELWSVVVQHSLTAADVERIDDLQLKHSALFDQVPEYSGLRPEAPEAPLPVAPRARRVAVRPTARVLVFRL